MRGALGKFYKAQRTVPDVPTYQGSKTTRNVGAFSGIADIQGSDAYAGACAPTMLPVIKRLPLQYPYYYLRNARDNHAPGVFWGYAQLYSNGACCCVCFVVCVCSQCEFACVCERYLYPHTSILGAICLFICLYHILAL